MTMTGKTQVATVQGMDGYTMSKQEYYARLIEQGYTIEKTPNGTLVHPPSKRVQKTRNALKSFVKAVKESGINPVTGEDL